MLIIFFSYRASAVKSTVYQFFFLSILLATACGVGNEILEFLGQYFFRIPFAINIYDTWLDLCANTVGILLASTAITAYQIREIHHTAHVQER